MYLTMSVVSTPFCILINFSLKHYERDKKPSKYVPYQLAIKAFTAGIQYKKYKLQIKSDLWSLIFDFRKKKLLFYLLRC